MSKWERSEQLASEKLLHDRLVREAKESIIFLKEKIKDNEETIILFEQGCEALFEYQRARRT